MSITLYMSHRTQFTLLDAYYHKPTSLFELCQLVAPCIKTALSFILPFIFLSLRLFVYFFVRSDCRRVEGRGGAQPRLLAIPGLRAPVPAPEAELL